LRFTILTKFFLSFLISGILLVGLMIGAMQFYTFQNFGEYVDQTELNKLTDLVTQLSMVYKEDGDWESIRRNHNKWRQIFIDSGLLDANEGQGPPQPGLRPDQPQGWPPPPRPIGPDHPERQFADPPGAHPGTLPPNGPPPDFPPPDFPPPDFPPPPGSSQPPGDNRGGQGDPRAPAPPPIQIDQGSGMLEVGPRLSLFDKNYQLVMGRARSNAGHVFRPILFQDEIVGYLGLQKLENLSNPLDEYYLKQQRKILYLVGGLFLLVSVFISFILASQLLSPIKKLSRATQKLAKRQFDTKLNVKTTDELGGLANDFNVMTEQLKGYELTQKQWLSDISHELRTPLAILIGEIDAVQDGIRKPDPTVIKSIQSEVFHLKRLIDDLHTLSIEEAKTLEHKTRPLDVLPLLEETLDWFTEDFLKKEITIETSLGNLSKDRILGDPDRLIQLFSNILKNTLRYTDAPGRLIIRNKVTPESIVIYFEDTAPTVPSEMTKRIFERLFRADLSRSRETGGSGIGLAICKTIVESHGGIISAKGSKLGGLQIQIEFPIMNSHT